MSTTRTMGRPTGLAWCIPHDAWDCRRTECRQARQRATNRAARRDRTYLVDTEFSSIYEAHYCDEGRCLGRFCIANTEGMAEWWPRRTECTDEWDEYAEWHLGLTDGAADHTKARYAFVYGDLRRVHRMGLIACHYRAAEWRHKDIELAAHELLQLLDQTSGSS